MNYQILINNGIKRLRKSNQLTQEKFAEAVGLTIESVRNIEHNKYTPTGKTIDSICSAFNITPFDLLLPDLKQDSELLDSIENKLKLCSDKELKVIDTMLDTLRQAFN